MCNYDYMPGHPWYSGRLDPKRISSLEKTHSFRKGEKTPASSTEKDQNASKLRPVC